MENLVVLAFDFAGAKLLTAIIVVLVVGFLAVIANVALRRSDARSFEASQKIPEAEVRDYKENPYASNQQIKGNVAPSPEVNIQRRGNRHH